MEGPESCRRIELPVGAESQKVPGVEASYRITMDTIIRPVCICVEERRPCNLELNDLYYYNWILKKWRFWG